MDEQKQTVQNVIDDVLKASFGEPSSQIRASFKKTVLIRQYETEVIEIDTVLNVDEPLTGAERMLISAALQLQLEYEVYCTLMIKGLITNTEFEERKASLATSFLTIRNKAESLTGRSMDKYLKPIE